MKKLIVFIALSISVNTLIFAQWEILNGNIHAANFGWEPIDFVNDNVGWTVSHWETLFKTEDFGETWEEIKIPGVTEEEQIHIDFINDSIGWVTALIGTHPNETRIYYTNDGGTTWDMPLKISDEKWSYYDNMRSK